MEEIKTISIDLGKDKQEIVILPLSDIHLGSALFNNKMFNKTVQRLIDEPNTYTILNGDLIDNSNKLSVGDVYGATLTPEQQINTLVELLQPIKDKILCATSGNHENRTYRTCGIDIMNQVMSRLGLKEKYSRHSYVLFVSFGKQSRAKKRENRRYTFSIYGRHGSGSGGTTGGKANVLKRMGGVVNNADIYMISHTHEPMIIPAKQFTLDNRTKTIRAIDQLYFNTTAFLDYGEYADDFGLPPNIIKNIDIILTHDEYNNKKINFRG